MSISANYRGFLFKVPNDYMSNDIGNKLDDFEILKNIGHGGSGHAIKVKSKKNYKLYVIKKNTEFNDTEKREIILMKKLDHPNVCKLKAFFEEKGNHYIVMDLFSNKDLFHYLSAYMQIPQRIKEENIWNIFKQTLEALTYIHNKGLIHRDIKLGNIFLDDSGKVVIGDFGLSAMINEKEFAKLNTEEQNLLKFTPIQCGTPQYLAPEVRNGENYDQKADVYSLGICFHCLLFHCFPPGENYAQILNNDTYYDYELRFVIFKMLTQNQNQRPNSMEVFQYFKKQYIKKFVANSSLYAVVQCLFNFPNFFNYFNDDFQVSYLMEKSVKKPVFLALLEVKNSFDNINQLEENVYVLRQKILGEDNRIKDNVDLSPLEFINIILNTLYYELNEINLSDVPKVEVNIFNNFQDFVKHYNERFLSFISLNFTGVIKKTLKCLNCNGEKIIFQKFNFVNLSMDNYVNYFNQNSVINIVDVIYYFNQTFVSYKSNAKIDCYFCNKKANYFENKKFYCFPKNLIITFEESKSNFVKIDFSEHICLKDEMNNYEYNLLGVISEINTNDKMKKRYICFIKKNNAWVYLDNNSNYNKQIFSFQNLKNYGKILALFYYDQSRVTSQSMNNININNNMAQTQFFNANLMNNNMYINNINPNNNMKMMNNNINIMNNNQYIIYNNPNPQNNPNMNNNNDYMNNYNNANNNNMKPNIINNNQKINFNNIINNANNANNFVNNNNINLRNNFGPIMNNNNINNNNSGNGININNNIINQMNQMNINGYI